MTNMEKFQLFQCGRNEEIKSYTEYKLETRLIFREVRLSSRD